MLVSCPYTTTIHRSSSSSSAAPVKAPALLRQNQRGAWQSYEPMDEIPVVR